MADFKESIQKIYDRAIHGDADAQFEMAVISANAGDVLQVNALPDGVFNPFRKFSSTSAK